jgi:hypothetical protein
MVAMMRNLAAKMKPPPEAPAAAVYRGVGLV